MYPCHALRHGGLLDCSDGHAAGWVRSQVPHLDGVLRRTHPETPRDEAVPDRGEMRPAVGPTRRQPDDLLGFEHVLQASAAYPPVGWCCARGHQIGVLY